MKIPACHPDVLPLTAADLETADAKHKFAKLRARKRRIHPACGKAGGFNIAKPERQCFRLCEKCSTQRENGSESAPGNEGRAAAAFMPGTRQSRGNDRPGRKR